MPRVLHISDLHVADAYARSTPRTLDQVWQPVNTALGDRKFDFIVVSGDLTDRATTEEYDALEVFARTRLVPRLVRRERSRIVFVPGNHDVSWDDEQFERIRLDEQEPNELPLLVRTAQRAPERSNQRINVTKFAHVELFNVKKQVHAARMRNAQNFLTKFYEGALTGNSRPFDLVRPGQDWSCHAFVEEGIVFIGLNSCFNNDKYWHGAGFDRETLLQAGEYLRELRRNGQLLVVAVWHHGFTSASGRPDRLSLADLGSVFQMGARIGLHGHTHAAESHHRTLLSGRMPVIATGSLAADSAERPDGTPNQFCTLTIQPTRVNVVVHKLDSQHATYQESELAPLFIADDREHPAHPPASCQRHSRTCEVNAYGIARIQVEIDELRCSGPVPLTVISRPYCGVNADKKARCDNSNVDVLEATVAEQKRRYSLMSSDHCSRMSWGYYISNIVALNREELALLPDRVEYPHLEPGEDAYSHTVRFACERLELWLIMEKHGPTTDTTRVMVERRAADGADVAWEPDNRETERVCSKLVWGKNQRGREGLVLTIDAPIVGHRYSLFFKPPGSDRAYPEEAAAIAERVIDDCRGKCFEDSILRAQLSATLGTAIEKELGEDVGDWSGHLWHAHDRALLASFGRFRSQGWSTYFEAGTGVAGHAFRHSGIVAWSREHGTGEAQTIFRKSLPLPGHRGPDYKWVLCVPLRIESDGPAIGVIGFARGDVVSPAAEKCERFVATIARKKGTEDKALTSVYEQLDRLEGRLYATFWATLAAAKQLPPDLREYARTRVARFVEAR